MRPAARLLLTWLLLLALPLQGWALSARDCHVAAGGAAGHVAQALAEAEAHGHGDIHAAAHPMAHPTEHAHAHAHALPASEDDAAMGHDPSAPSSADATSAPAGCSHCAACCVGAVLLSRADTPRAAPAHLPPCEALRTTVVSFLTDGPDRPPRAF
jgi:hypothetical protein